MSREKSIFSCLSITFLQSSFFSWSQAATSIKKTFPRKRLAPKWASSFLQNTIKKLSIIKRVGGNFALLSTRRMWVKNSSKWSSKLPPEFRPALYNYYSCLYSNYFFMKTPDAPSWWWESEWTAFETPTLNRKAAKILERLKSFKWIKFQNKIIATEKGVRVNLKTEIEDGNVCLNLLCVQLPPSMEICVESIISTTTSRIFCSTEKPFMSSNKILNL